MTACERLIIAVAALWATSVALPFGCEADRQAITAAPETQPAPGEAPPPAEPQLPPLPDRATLSLAELPPPIEKPVNPQADDTLPPRAREEVAEAERLLAQRNHAGAIELLERAVGFDPRNARVRRLLGQAYLALPNRGKAYTNLVAAAEAAPDDLETQLLLGQLAAAQQQTDQALLHLRTAGICSQAKPEDPRAAEALLTLSLLLDREGYWTAALEGYERLSEWVDRHGREYTSRAALREWVLHPDRLLSRRGGLLLLLRRPAEAAEVLDWAYRRDRTNGRTATLLVEALLADKRYEQVEKLLLELASQPAQSPNVPRMFAELCRATLDRSLPERFWQTARDKRKADPALAVALAKGAQELGWSDEAVAVLQSVLTSRPTDPELWRILCRHHAERRQYDRLFELMADSLKAQPQAVEAAARGIDQLAAVAQPPGFERTFAELARKDESPARHLLLYVAGRLAARVGKHVLAADLYDRATEFKPDFLPAYEALLDAYIAQDRLDRADRLLERIDKAAPDSHLPPYLRGKVALRRGNVTAALEALRQALQRKADDLPTSLLLADALAAGGQADEAVKVLQAAIGAHPDDESAPRRLFDLYMLGRQFREARDVAAALLRRTRDSLAGRMMIAELALQTGRRNEAMVLLSQLSREAPDNQDVQVLSVRAALGPTPSLVSKSDFDEGVEKLTRILGAEPGSRDARKALADLLAGVGKADEAAGIWASLLDETPGDQDLAARYVGALLDANQHETALRAVERFRKDRPDDLWGRARHMELLGKLGRFEELIAATRRWMKEADDDNARLLYRGELLRILDVQKQYGEALKLLEEWIAQRTDGPDLRRLEYSRIRLLTLARDFDKARAEADRLAGADPLTDARQLIPLVAAQAKDYETALRFSSEQVASGRQLLRDLEACRAAVADLADKKRQPGAEYEAAVRKLPESLRASVSLAVSDGQHAEALADLARWEQGAEERLGAVRLLEIVAAGEAKQLPRARALAEEWAREDPNALPPRRAVVALLVEADAVEEADRLVGRWGAELTPTTAPTQPAEPGETVRWLMEMSVRLKLLRRAYPEAAALADRFLKADPRNAELLALKSACLTELGRDEEALAVLESALALEEDSPSLNNNLGYLYAERGVKLDQAERMLRKALSVLPEETAFRDSFAWVLYKQGRLLEAGRVFQQLLARRPGGEDEHGVIVDHAGDTYYRLGWKDQALKFWQRAVELARKAKRPAREETELLSRTPAKIEAVRQGREPQVAPLGEEAARPQPRPEN